MPVATLVATVPAWPDLGPADPPAVLSWGRRTLVMQRGDTEVAVRDLAGQQPERRFPAPWPRRYGSVTVSPAGDLAVFAGVHALRALDANGVLRWELRHGCWSAAWCTVNHATFAEYAEDDDHSFADHGSAAFSPDGERVWAHVRDYADDEIDEQWMVVDAADGTVLGRTATMTAGSFSAHFPHPDPAYMGLTVGEGDEDSPVLWGHWDGRTLTAGRYVEKVFLAVAPSGGHFLTADPGQWSLHLHRATDGTRLRLLDAETAVPPATGGGRVRWDLEAAFPWDDVAVAGTEDDAGAPRHWLVDLVTMTVRGPVTYPVPVAGPARSAGPGLWCTISPGDAAVHLWTLTGGGCGPA
ncbi:hypothetical protein AB0G04_26625 [Actinoplanes sp. NPDC023801]|uniref:hypothetical protein n=1 Tax=Actinoplanes sp. NPDC023801 TaxID=3154595 RepID=UPI00340A8156